MKKTKYVFKNKVLNYPKLLKSINEDFKNILIIGSTNGGTTLLTALLYQNYKIDSYLKESQFDFNVKSAFYIKRSVYFQNFKDYFNTISFTDFDIINFKKACLSIYKLRSKPNFNQINTVIDKSPNVHFYRLKVYHKCFSNLFPIVIFRDPVEVISGMKKKWILFRQASIKDLAFFWVDSYNQIFEFENFTDLKLLFINLEKLKNDTDNSLKSIEDFTSIEKRKIPLSIKHSNSKQGKGLRVSNSNNIVISSKSKIIDNLTDDEVMLIKKITNTLYGLLCEKAN